MISIALTDQAVTDYATFYGWTVDNTQTASEFTSQKLLDKVAGDLVEKRNRDAMQVVATKPLPDITTDSSAPDIAVV